MCQTAQEISTTISLFSPSTSLAFACDKLSPWPNRLVTNHNADFPCCEIPTLHRRYPTCRSDLPCSLYQHALPRRIPRRIPSSFAECAQLNKLEYLLDSGFVHVKKKWIRENSNCKQCTRIWCCVCISGGNSYSCYGAFRWYIICPQLGFVTI